MVRGMMISRRPNKRASRENAPGPRKASATAMLISNVIAARESSKLPVESRNSEDILPRLLRAANTPAGGVK